MLRIPVMMAVERSTSSTISFSAVAKTVRGIRKEIRERLSLKTVLLSAVEVLLLKTDPLHLISKRRTTRESSALQAVNQPAVGVEQSMSMRVPVILHLRIRVKARYRL